MWHVINGQCMDRWPCELYVACDTGWKDLTKADKIWDERLKFMFCLQCACKGDPVSCSLWHKLQPDPPLSLSPSLCLAESLFLAYPITVHLHMIVCMKYIYTIELFWNDDKPTSSDMWHNLRSNTKTLFSKCSTIALKIKNLLHMNPAKGGWLVGVW